MVEYFHNGREVKPSSRIQRGSKMSHSHREKPMDGVFYPAVTLERAAAPLSPRTVADFVRSEADGRAACVIQGSRASPAASNGPERRTLFARLSARGGSPLGRFTRIILPFSNAFGIRYK